MRRKHVKPSPSPTAWQKKSLGKGGVPHRTYLYSPSLSCEIHWRNWFSLLTTLKDVSWTRNPWFTLPDGKQVVTRIQKKTFSKQSL